MKEWGVPGNTLFYPIDMGSDPSKTPDAISVNRPIIMFTCASRVTNGDSQYIGFPIPQGIEFSDGASYDDAALGYAGAATAAVVKTGMEASDIASKAAGIIGDIGDGGIDSLKNKFGSAAIAAISNSKLGDNIKSGVGIAMKMTTNKHIVTEFTGVSTRSFGFKFKLVGSSKKESEIIRNIGTAFRNGLYPEADRLALKYPPTWTIRFMMGNNDISYLPKIWECYLTALSVSYNGSANLWHTDGAPIECEISVSFKETRALRHQDIRNLDTNAFINIPPGNRDGYKVLGETEPLFANSGTTNLSTKTPEEQTK
jgi:hypothetical protein